MAKKKDPSKRLRYRFRYNGERYAVYGYTKAELIEKAAKKKRELEAGIQSGRCISVIKWRDEWLETYKHENVTERSYKAYVSILQHLDLTMPVSDVKPVHLQQIVNSMAGMSDHTIKKFMVLVRACFEAAADNGLCATNPAKNLTRPKGYLRARRPLTKEERALVEKVLPTSRAGTYIALMLYAGCRPAEAGAVMGEDIDLVNRLLHIRGTKTAAADRYVPISDKLLPYVKDLTQNQYAVVNSRGEPTGPDSRKNLWNQFLRELNIAAGAKTGRPTKHTPWDVPLENLLADDLVPYILRHTFCTDLEAAGVPINVARDFMGHTDISVTSKIYTHRSAVAIENAAKRMNEYAP